MPKDTKSSGYNKAPACESRGFGHKKEGENFDTPSFKTGPHGTLNMDNPAFWEWFKQDYRGMLDLIPEIDGLVLTFIETGAYADNDPVRMVDALVESLNLESFRKLYKECGRSPYHPKMMLKVIMMPT